MSTNLGVAYFYTDDVDQSLAQFERSLELDPTHGQTLLSIGIVRAFGKQDFDGAIEVWEEVQRLMPGSREAIAAADAIEQMRSMHP